MSKKSISKIQSNKVVPLNDQQKKISIVELLSNKKNQGYQNLEKDKHNKSSYEYMHDKIPPNFRIAKEHALAMRIGPEKEVDQIKMCICCSRKLERGKLNLCCDQIDLAYIGSGYPLYFSFLKFCGVILLVLLFSSGGYNLATNYYYGDTCQLDKNEDKNDNENNDEIQQNCERDWITVFSIGNKQGKTDLIMWQDILNFCSLILMIILFQFFRKYTKQLDQECDVADISAVDYTILMKDIPLEYDAINNDYDDDIADFIENKFMEEGQVKVISVNLAYKMELLYYFKSERQKLIEEKKQEIDYYYKHKQYKNNTLEELDQKIQKIELQVEDLIGHFLEGKGKTFMKKYFTGWAFITVQTEEQKDKILQKANDKGTVFKRNNGVIYHGKKVNLEPAPDPTNVFWENLHIDNHTKREIRSYLLMVLWILFCFSIVFPLMLWQKNVSLSHQEKLEEIQKDKDISTLENFADQLYLQATALTLSLVITVLNAVSYNVIKLITDSERQWTRTLYNISAIKKLSLTQFIISALLTFMVEIFIIQQENSTNFNKIFGQGGLVYNQSFVFILNSIVPFFTELIDFETQLKRLIKKYLYNNVDEGFPILYTQHELNELFEYPEFDIIRRYSDCLKTMYLCAFYSPIIPLGMLWCLLAILLHFWVDKYNLLRRRVVKHNMSSDLSIEMTEMLEFVLIIYCLGNLIFWIFILGDYNNLSYWAVGGVFLGLIHAMLPMDMINSKICYVKEAPPNIQPIEEVQIKFLTDYARENPATAKKAKQNFLEQISIMKEQEKINNKNQKMADLLHEYTNNNTSQPILSKLQPAESLNSNRYSVIQMHKIMEAQNNLTTNQTETDELISQKDISKNLFAETSQNKLKKTSFFMKKKLKPIKENTEVNSPKTPNSILKKSVFLRKFVPSDDELEEEESKQNYDKFSKNNKQFQQKNSIFGQQNQQYNYNKNIKNNSNNFPLLNTKSNKVRFDE